MPYSDHVPGMVLPDIHESREAAQVLDPFHDTDVGYCREWKEDYFPMPHPANYTRRCANRRADGDRHHNWCHHCMVGYVMLTAAEGDLYARRGNRTEALVV